MSGDDDNLKSVRAYMARGMGVDEIVKITGLKRPIAKKLVDQVTEENAQRAKAQQRKRPC